MCSFHFLCSLFKLKKVVVCRCVLYLLWMCNFHKKFYETRMEIHQFHVNLVWKITACAFKLREMVYMIAVGPEN